MSYEIVLDAFSGPLDLLLHLIQKQEVSIHDIEISRVTEQYMDYLHAMEELSLDIASEFIVMAATLLAIKSRMLLPKPAVVEDEEEEDPRELLIQQLLEYQRCKWAAEELKTRHLLRSHVFTREPLDLRPYVSHEPAKIEGVSLWDLVDAFRKLVSRVPQEERVAEIPGTVINVEEMMEQMLTRLRRWKRCRFSDLIQQARTRPEVVSAFLALLELVKAQQVVCTQITNYSDIEIEWIEESSVC